MFVDASALVAILKVEHGSDSLLERLDASPDAVTSPIAVLETVISLSRQKALDSDDVLTTVQTLCERFDIDVKSVDVRTGELAVRAYAAYGKGSGHPARLNLGDCFAYAMAKQLGVRLLYKGDDFARTDLA